MDVLKTAGVRTLIRSPFFEATVAAVFFPYRLQGGSAEACAADGAEVITTLDCRILRVTAVDGVSALVARDELPAVIATLAHFILKV